ncbi:hypothetical protein IFT73_03070 [Aeromicrobium sp. CFBP 8757]|uniref:hypothetical protein n=1 Tax=Aeromicrobium sp. CFBP 8757 TaxID=2775288 RepID=UPI001784A2BE|nr:hypothetical protein [Aeromicrobium sp. CFBP 8757]MBD8605825.1 hypothetical protein [Aeromicrobium sp. CFBP 8757]
MTRRGQTVAACVGVALAGTVAWIVGWDLSSRYGYDTYDNLVGGSGIVAVVLALIALPRSGWARVPLLASVVVSALMAYARFDPSPNAGDIDVTPLFLPPLVVIFGVTALFMVAMRVSPDGARNRRT